jgi:hypothetical protein
MKLDKDEAMELIKDKYMNLGIVWLPQTLPKKGYLVPVRFSESPTATAKLSVADKFVFMRDLVIEAASEVGPKEFLLLRWFPTTDRHLFTRCVHVILKDTAVRLLRQHKDGEFYDCSRNLWRDFEGNQILYWVPN